MYSKLLFDKGFNLKLERLLNTGKIKIGKSGRLVPANPQGSRNSPWIFLNQNTRHKFCGIWNGVYCLHFDLIPTHCRFECWKIVAKPRTLEELLDVYQGFRELGYPSKCGADLRNYTYGPWSGFVYSDSLEQGKEYYKIVRKRISKKIPVILKRGCTEMEALLPTTKWDHVTSKEIELEQRLNDMFEFNEMHFIQAEWTKQRIKESWVKRAIEIGDSTARKVAVKLTGNPKVWEQLVVQSITYHEE